jgi:uncharacterized protein YdiU (UPF0061 family)
LITKDREIWHYANDGYFIGMVGSVDKNNIGVFDNSYAALPEQFYERIQPVAVKAPTLVRLNDALAKELQLDLRHLNQDAMAALFAGNTLAQGTDPIAQAYSGHQFGHFSGQLGDGRAILLGEVIDRSGKRRDIQLKGSGRTRFSRSGDGRAALGPVIREYILSESMHCLGIPTTRSLAMVTTGEEVMRETPLPGAVLTRIASSHIRVGTFQYFSSRQDAEAVKQLADYVIERHYPEVKEEQNAYLALLKSIANRQASLIAKWMHVGFIHGVMNTDNSAISGETIDYGPCAFMDEYDPGTVFSSIDQRGRYAYDNQANIAHWNLTRLAECLLGLFDKNQAQSIKMAEEVLAVFPITFEEYWLKGMCWKIGINERQSEDVLLIQDLLALMQKHKTDYTLGFRYLCDGIEASEEASVLKGLFSNDSQFDAWCGRWRKRLLQGKKSPAEITQSMRSVNPAFTPRNHRVQQAIEAAVNNNDFSKTEDLIKVLSNPFEDQPSKVAYMDPPKSEERVLETFCGT